MGTNGASALKYTTTCRLCGHQILDHPLNVQIVGQPDARAQNLLSALMKHLEKKHKDAWVQIQGLWQFFLGFLCLGQFETADPAIVQTIQGFGAVLRNMVRPASIADDDIVGAVAQLGFTLEDPKREPVIAAMKNVRAYYEGTLQRPAEPEPKPLIAPVASPSQYFLRRGCR
jgi:hypothetical protein